LRVECKEKTVLVEFTFSKKHFAESDVFQMCEVEQIFWEALVFLKENRRLLFAENPNMTCFWWRGGLFKKREDVKRRRPSLGHLRAPAISRQIHGHGSQMSLVSLSPCVS